VDGKITGYGTFTWAHGDRYTGRFVNDKKHGQGTYYYSNGSRYEGGWVNDKQTGRGTWTNADGSPFRADTDGDGDGDSDFGDFLMFVGAAIGVAATVKSMTSGSSGGGSGGGGSVGTPFYTNPSKKGTSGGSCSKEMMSGTCSCWNPCCQWTWLDDGDGLSKAWCSVK